MYFDLGEVSEGFMVQAKLVEGDASVVQRVRVVLVQFQHLCVCVCVCVCARAPAFLSLRLSPNQCTRIAHTRSDPHT